MVHANDLVIEPNTFKVDHRLNDVIVSSNGFLPYASLADDLNADVEMIVTWDCNKGAFGTCEAKPPTMQATLEAISYTVNVLGQETIHSTFNIGHHDVPASQIRYRNCDAALSCLFIDQVVSYTLPLSNNMSDGTSFDTWAADTYQNGYFRRLQITINSDGNVPELIFPNDNDDTYEAVPKLFPLAGTLSFGNVDTELAAAYSVTEACPGFEPAVRYAGDLDWTPSSNGLWPEVRIPSVNICTSYILSLAGTGFELVAEEAVIVGGVAGQHGGDFDVTAGLIQLAPTGIISLGNFVVELPVGLSYHAGVDGSPVPRGSQSVGLLLSDNSVDDLSELVATTVVGFLHSRKLPFSVELASMTLNETSLSGTFAGTHYNQARTLDTTDPRHPVYNPDRVNGLASNDLRFIESAPPTDGNFVITTSGLSLSANFGAAVGATHFPTTLNSWDDFNISVVNSALTDNQPLSGRNAYFFKMASNCAQCGTEGVEPNHYLLSENNVAGLSADGASAMPAEIPVDPQWGTWDLNANRSIFRRQGDSDKTGYLYLPGFQAIGSGGDADSPVVEYLMASRKIVNDGGVMMPSTVYPLSSYMARRGNYFPPGFTVGPEFYSTGANSQPLIGIGVDMSNSGTDIGFGGVIAPDYVLTETNIAAKYVVRAGGLTGVFNTLQIPQPNVYGYDLNLSRFAYRLVTNDLDPYSWIDGNVQVEGKGDFGIEFMALSLECSGNVGGGIVAYEQCADSIDNNNNGLTDENCNEQLGAWSTPIDLLSMRFDADSSVSMCDAQTRELVVGNSVELHALGAPLGMQANWSAGGQPSQVTINGDTEHVLDQPKTPEIGHDMGFAIALNSDISLKTPGININTDGWFAMDGMLGVPFWNAMDVSTRVANDSLSSAAQSIVIAKGSSLFGSVGSDDSKTNAEMADELKNSGEFDANYTWGLTGFELDLPVYYRSGRLSANKRPEFSGVQLTTELVVIDLNSGINYIDPARTKISFGASADFEALAQLEFGLHIDLNDPESVTDIDGFLCNALSISGCPAGPVAGLIDDVQSKMNLLNLVADAGLDGFLEEGVRAALPSAPFNTMAEKIALVQTLPEQVAMVVSSGLQGLTGQLLDPLTDQLDTAASEVFDTLPSLLVRLNASPTPAELSVINTELRQIITTIESLIAGIDGVTTPLNEAANLVNTTRGDIEAFAGETLGWVNDAVGAINVVRTSLNDLKGVCQADFNQSNTGNVIVDQIVSAKNTIQGAVDTLQIVDIEKFANLLSLVSGIDLSAVSNAQGNIEQLANELQVRLVEGIDGIEEQLCGAGSALVINDAYDQADQLLSDISVVLADANTQIDALKLLLISHRTPGGDEDGGYLGLVDNSLQVAGGLVGNLKVAFRKLATDIDAELDGAGKYAEYSQSAIENDLNQIISGLTNGAYGWVAGAESFVSSLGDTLRAPIDNAIANATAQASVQLSGLVSIVPYQTGEQLKTFVVDEIMNSFVMEAINNLFYTYFTEITADLNGLTNFVFDQANAIIQSAIVAVEESANELLQSATGAITENIPITAAKVDGYATIVGNELERLHIGSEWTMQGDSDDNSSSFNAALDITSWNANGKADGCASAGDLSSVLDAVISTKNLPISIAGSDTSIKELYLGFSLQPPASGGVPVPVNVFGGISLDGTISFEAFDLYDVGFKAGVGALENYLGATAGAIFSDIQIEAAFLVGKTCNTDVLLDLDAQAAEFITFPGGVFNGAYVRGSASIPIYNAGCPLTVGVGADAGVWLLVGAPLTIGGLVGGSAYGEAACLASIRGQVTVFGEKSGDQYKFRGEAFGVAGLGFDCDPGTWTDVPRSRNDSWCGTADAEFGITATVKGDGSLEWDVGSPSASAIY